MNKFNISQMKKYKQIDGYFITDALILKNNYEKRQGKCYKIR